MRRAGPWVSGARLVLAGVAVAHGGFLTWNELWVEGRGWRPVDATFGQPLADATHLKLLEGETPRP